jgi:hypothetical protein
MTPNYALKFLRWGYQGLSVTPRLLGPWSDHPWPLPRGEKPGKWVTVSLPLEPCRNGIHACTLEQARHWARYVAFVIELDGKILRHESHTTAPKMVAERGRLIRRIDWAYTMPLYLLKHRLTDEERERMIV